MRTPYAPTFALLTAATALAGCRAATEPGVFKASGHFEATEVRLAAKVGGPLVSLPSASPSCHRDKDRLVS